MNHRNKLIKYLLILLVIFALLCLIAFVDEINNIKIFDMSIGIENYLVITLSLLSMIKILFELKSID